MIQGHEGFFPASKLPLLVLSLHKVWNVIKCMGLTHGFSGPVASHYGSYGIPTSL
jgi:hypothetical protein